MHVLLLGPYPPPEGGINRNTLAIREELAAAGHRCSMLVTSRSTWVDPEADVHHPKSVFDFLRHLRGIDSDILHLHVGGDISARVMALVFLSAVFGRGKKVLSFHSGGYPSTAKGKAAGKYSIRGFIFRLFDRIIAVNSSIAEVFARYCVDGKKIEVIYPFVHRLPDPGVKLRPDLREFAEKLYPFLLTVGLLEDEYDLFMQIDAMEGVLEQNPTAGLMIIGSGSLQETLEQAIAAKPYGSNILLAGDVEHRQTLHLINRCDALLRTTLFDGDAISVREALFLDTPVIATDNGLRPEGVRLIPIGDKNSLVREISTVAERKHDKKMPTRDDKSNIHSVLRVYHELLN